jgi:hypothetical protein
MGSSGEDWNQGHTFSLCDENYKRSIWRVTDLWAAAKGLTPFTIQLSDLEDTYDTWLGRFQDPDYIPSDEDSRRIREADLKYPIILHPEGFIMDGFHRVAKCLKEGTSTIQAVQFTDANLPPPTWTPEGTAPPTDDED